MAATVGYYLLPFGKDLDRHIVGVVVLGLPALGVLPALQAVGIIRSPRPRLRSAEALTTAPPLFLLLFAATYFLYARKRAGTPCLVAKVLVGAVRIGLERQQSATPPGRPES